MTNIEDFVPAPMKNNRGVQPPFNSSQFVLQRILDEGYPRSSLPGDDDFTTLRPVRSMTRRLTWAMLVFLLALVFIPLVVVGSKLLNSFL